jgi:hypothetical protein
MVGLLRRVISPSQGLYLHRTTQYRNTWTNIHAFSGIRTHDPSNQPAKTQASDRTATVTGVSHLTWTTLVSSYTNHVVLMTSLRNINQQRYVTRRVSSAMAYWTRPHGLWDRILAKSKLFSVMQPPCYFTFYKELLFPNFCILRKSINMALLQVALVSITLHKFLRPPCWYYRL